MKLRKIAKHVTKFYKQEFHVVKKVHHLELHSEEKVQAIVNDIRYTISDYFYRVNTFPNHLFSLLHEIESIKAGK